MADADPLVHDLDHRRETVGGTGGRRDDVVRVRIVQVVVDADHDIEGAVDRRGDHHLFHALVKVGLQGLRGAKPAGRLDYQFDTLRRPVDRTGCVVLRIAHVSPVDRYPVIAGGRLPPPAAMHGIEIQQVCGAFRVTRNLVQVHELQFIRAPRGTQREPAHAAEAVDGGADGLLYPVLVRAGIAAGGVFLFAAPDTGLLQACLNRLQFSVAVRLQADMVEPGAHPVCRNGEIDGGVGKLPLGVVLFADRGRMVKQGSVEADVFFDSIDGNVYVQAAHNSSP